MTRERADRNSLFGLKDLARPSPFPFKSPRVCTSHLACQLTNSLPANPAEAASFTSRDCAEVAMRAYESSPPDTAPMLSWRHPHSLAVLSKTQL